MTQAIMVSMDKKNADNYPTRDKGFMLKRLSDIYFVAMTKFYKEYD